MQQTFGSAVRTDKHAVSAAEVYTALGDTSIPKMVERMRTYKTLYLPKNFPIFSFKNFKSSGFGPAPAVCPHNDGIGVSVTVLMNAAS